MSDWVPFEKGTYGTERAFLVAPDGCAVELWDTIVEVYQGQAGARQVKGRCFVSNLLVVELLEENETQRAFWYWPNTWVDSCVDVWSDPRFPALVERFGFVEYWSEVGWPSACKPSDDGIACGRAAETG